MNRENCVNNKGIPLISIIVPVYNSEDYVSECIESIMQQTYENLQIILIDDESTDASGEICDKYAAEDQRIEVIHQKNTGVSMARKNALTKARGEYIGFVDGDDSIVPDMYEKLLQEIQNSGADFVHSGYIRNGQCHVLYHPGLVHFQTMEDKIKFLKDNVCGENSCVLPSIWSKLFKSDLIKKCYGKVPDDCFCSVDYIILCTSVLESSKILLVDGAYCQYRDRESSLTNKKEFGTIARGFQLFLFLERIFSEYKCYDQLKGTIQNQIYQGSLRRMRNISQNRFQTEVYHYGHVDELLGKRIVVYGAGDVGLDYYAQFSRYTDCQVVAWVDKHPEKCSYPYVRVDGADVLKEVDFDVLVIAVQKKEVAEEIRKELLEKGIVSEKIIWNKPELAHIT